jgi:hypothetical protein
MSTRERWIVYPLLFLALGTAIKPKLTSPESRRVMEGPASLSIDKLWCTQLRIVGEDDRPRIIAFADEGGGRIHVVDNNGQTVVALSADPKTRAGLVETFNEKGNSQASMMSSGSGGGLVVYDNQLRRSVGIIHRDGQSGLIQTDLRTGKESLEPAETPD